MTVTTALVSRWHGTKELWQDFCAVFRILNRQGELRRLTNWATQKNLPGPRELYERRLLDEESKLTRFAVHSPRLVRWVRLLHKLSYLVRKSPRFPAKGSASVYQYGTT